MIVGSQVSVLGMFPTRGSEGEKAFVEVVVKSTRNHSSIITNWSNCPQTSYLFDHGVGFGLLRYLQGWAVRDTVWIRAKHFEGQVRSTFASSLAAIENIAGDFRGRAQCQEFGRVCDSSLQPPCGRVPGRRLEDDLPWQSEQTFCLLCKQEILWGSLQRRPECCKRFQERDDVCPCWRWEPCERENLPNLWDWGFGCPNL